MKRTNKARKLERRIDAWKRSVDSRGKNSVDSDAFHKPGSYK